MHVECSADPDRFTDTSLGLEEVEELAQRYCDPCPRQTSCYRTAIRDPLAWGVYGGVMFFGGDPVPRPGNGWSSRYTNVWTRPGGMPAPYITIPAAEAICAEVERLYGLTPELISNARIDKAAENV